MGMEMMTSTSNNPLGSQEGGNHYKDCPIQPVEYIYTNELDFLQGSVVKYITRFRNKNGEQDLNKANPFYPASQGA